MPPKPAQTQQVYILTSTFPQDDLAPEIGLFCYNSLDDARNELEDWVIERLENYTREEFTVPDSAPRLENDPQESNAFLTLEHLQKSGENLEVDHEHEIESYFLTDKAGEGSVQFRASILALELR